MRNGWMFSRFYSGQGGQAGTPPHLLCWHRMCSSCSCRHCLDAGDYCRTRSRNLPFPSIGHRKRRCKSNSLVFNKKLQNPTRGFAIPFFFCFTKYFRNKPPGLVTRLKRLTVNMEGGLYFGIGGYVAARLTDRLCETVGCSPDS